MPTLITGYGRRRFKQAQRQSAESNHRANERSRLAKERLRKERPAASTPQHSARSLKLEHNAPMNVSFKSKKAVRDTCNAYQTPPKNKQYKRNEKNFS
ncbi:MAG: hypothetical protein CMM07_16485 [Rhodopirellula sp.]|nr:hypothetical protein [Rhodopirellula sp.]